MNSQVYFVPGQTERIRKTFLRWKSIELSLNYLLHVRVMLTIIKCSPSYSYSENREHPGNFQNKSVTSPFNRVSRYILFSAKLKGRGRHSVWCKEGDNILRFTHSTSLPQEHLVVIRDQKVCPFVKFEIILPLLCFLLDPLANKYCRTWRSIIKFWIDSRTFQK